MDGEAISRRNALGLGGLGLLGASLAGSALLRGDAGPASPGQPVAQGAARRPAVRPASAGPAGGQVAAPPAPGDIPPLPVLRRPAHKVHEIRPDAPENAIALTIDDGPHPEWTPRILDLLARHDVKATFFLIGIQIRDHPDLIRRMAEEGHEIANHTMRHPIAMNVMPAKKIETELRQAHRMIDEVVGIRPRLFRAPGGNWSRSIFKAVAAQGMVPIDWDVDPRDWARPGVGRISDALQRCRAGDILLCHDGGGDRSQTLASLRRVLPRLKARDLEFITL